MDRLINFFKTAFPYIAVLLLWRLSVPFWNPVGILAIIPIFYYSFIRPTPWFVPFAALFCFLIDYRFDTLLFWTALYFLFYAINGFQSFLDITHQDKDGLLVFMGFFGVGTVVLFLSGLGWSVFFQSMWLFAWTSVLYIPFSALARRISND